MKYNFCLNKHNLLHMKHNCNRNRLCTYIISIGISSLLIIYFLISIYLMANGCFTSNQMVTPTNASLQEGIAKELIRFHVIANSDSTNDQEVKLIVKDAIIEYLKPFLIDVQNKKEAEEIILDHMYTFPSIAEQVLENLGYSYNVTASFYNTYFPIKSYGDIALPAGYYDALVIKLGKAEGKNWWCIMYPRLCFIDGVYAIVPETSKSELKYILTDEEFEAILSEPPKIKYKFKIIQWLEDLLL